MFYWGVAQSELQRISTACDGASSLVSSNQNLWTVVGEWTQAMTDCAKYLNGRGVGSHYEGTYPGSSHVGSCTGTDRVGRFVHSELQDVLEADVGGSGDHVREGERVDHVDVEGGGCGRMVVSSQVG
jgi:hypothetical protein